MPPKTNDKPLLNMPISNLPINNEQSSVADLQNVDTDDMNNIKNTNNTDALPSGLTQTSFDSDDIEDDDIEDDDFDISDGSDIGNGKNQPSVANSLGEGDDNAILSELSAKSSLPNASEIEIKAQHTVESSDAGQRIDKLAVSILPDQSRAQIQEWLKGEQLTVNGEVVKPKYRVKQGDSIKLQAVQKQHSDDEPENIPLDIVYEDDSVVVINKPVGMVVHPGAGNWTGTLVNALLYHYPAQDHLPRAGLVHRIDKDTSGLLVIGKTKAAQMALQAQLKDKSVYRHYRCIVAGDAASLMRQRVINAPIGRHRVQRTKMTVTSMGKEAVTHLIDITPLSKSYCLVDVRLETGRTHQIRVHLSHIGHPLIGDSIYGTRKQLRAGISEKQRQAVMQFPRQALHAYKLGFIHPVTGEDIEVTAPMPEDILQLMAVLSD